MINRQYKGGHTQTRSDPIRSEMGSDGVGVPEKSYNIRVCWDNFTKRLKLMTHGTVVADFRCASLLLTVLLCVVEGLAKTAQKSLNTD